VEHELDSHSLSSDWQQLRQLLSGKTVEVARPGNLVALAKTNRLAGYLYVSAKDKLGGWSEDLDELRRLYLEKAGYSMIADRMLEHVLELLERERITCMPIKGAVFRHFLYPDPATRPAVDLDICVHPDDYERCHKLLVDGGFSRLDASEVRPVTADTVYERVYCPPDDVCTIGILEIHRGLIKDGRYPVPLEEVLERGLSVPAFLSRIQRSAPESFPANENVRLMTPEDALVHQFLHNANHCFEMPPLAVLDSSLIMQHWSPDWGRVVDLARSWGLTAAAHYTLEAVEAVLGIAAPGWVRAALLPAWVRRQWLDRFIVPGGFVEWDEAAQVHVVRFLRWLRELRAQQVLVGLPLIDSPLGAARFSASYLKLRAQDMLAHRYGPGAGE